MTNKKRYEKQPIVIIGAGPTGTALAIDLALRNTPSILVERFTKPERIPKGQNLTQRTGEHFKFWAGYITGQVLWINGGSYMP